MNEHVKPPMAGAAMPLNPVPRASTRAAEGHDRWRWTTDELIRMVEAGILHPDERIELIGGEIVPVSPAGRRHEVVTDEIAQVWFARVAGPVKISVERQFNLDEATYTEPDLVVRPASVKMYDLRGPQAELVVEVADTSLAYDNGAKAALYAAFGVREYWVVNAVTLETRVHLGPTAAGYTSAISHPPTTMLTPYLVPALTIRLADLDLD